MMKASVDLNNLQILLPMISNMNEVDYSIYLLERAYQELLDEGLAVQKPPIGVMIEVPAAVYQIGAIAKRADFLSVGSNDLTQYLLAVDRNNPRVSRLFSTLHPSVLRVLKNIIDEAKALDKKVSICGEM